MQCRYSSRYYDSLVKKYILNCKITKFRNYKNLNHKKHPSKNSANSESKIVSQRNFWKKIERLAISYEVVYFYRTWGYILRSDTIGLKNDISSTTGNFRKFKQEFLMMESSYSIEIKKFFFCHDKSRHYIISILRACQQYLRMLSCPSPSLSSLTNLVSFFQASSWALEKCLISRMVISFLFPDHATTNP